jgi:Rps23 Pro-64 3,4-dihydroxylase Tpa1-like proline 4-hydroxylase
MQPNLLSNILIKENVIKKEGIDFLVNYMKKASKEDLSVFDPEKSNNTRNTEWVTDKNYRDTQICPIEPVFPQIEDLMKNLVFNIINPFYEFEIKDSEVPQLLYYGVGGHYQPHIDGYGEWTNPDGTRIWRKSVDRDLSMILYLNNDFEGGDFIFPTLNIRVRPKPGMLITFPSTPEYLHGVEPVTKGERFAIVNWMTIKGFPTVADEEAQFQKQYGHLIKQEKV